MGLPAEIARCYELFFYAAWAARLAFAGETISLARSSYYEAEKEKAAFDKAVLKWRSARDWKRNSTEEREMGTEISRLGNWADRTILDLQKGFLLFIYPRQTEAFPVTHARKGLSTYELMLFRLREKEAKHATQIIRFRTAYISLAAAAD